MISEWNQEKTLAGIAKAMAMLHDENIAIVSRFFSDLAFIFFVLGYCIFAYGICIFVIAAYRRWKANKTKLFKSAIDDEHKAYMRYVSPRKKI